MSITDLHDDDALGLPDGGATIPDPARRGGRPWTWTAIACILLGASGAVRAMQERRHEAERSYVEECPITIASIPKELGVWKLVEGGEKRLDELTMRITGGTQHIVRTYADDLTGVTLTVLVLYGPAEPVLPHTPDVCYPSSGFSRSDGPSDSTIRFSMGKDDKGRALGGEARFRSSVFQKTSGRNTFREAAFHSFRLDGQWSPDIGSGRKFPRRNPGVFKIQVQRQVADGESLGEGDPIEHFLSALLTEMEKEIKDASGKAVASR